MNTQMIICMVIFAATLVSYMLNKIPMWLTALISMAALYITGCIDDAGALSGFSNVNTLLMACMFIVAAGFRRTSLVDGMCNSIMKLTHGSFKMAYFGYILLAVLLTNFISSPMVVYAIISPLLAALCDKTGNSRTQYMFPIMVVCVACCGILPLATSIQMAGQFTGFMETYGFTGMSVRPIDFTIAAWPVLIVVPLWAIFLGPKFTPKQPVVPIEALEKKDSGKAQQKLSPVVDKIGIFLFFATIICLIFAPQLHLTTWFVALVGSLLMVLFGVVDQKSALRDIPWDMLMLFVGALALGTALTNTGAGDMIGQTLANSRWWYSQQLCPRCPVLYHPLLAHSVHAEPFCLRSLRSYLPADLLRSGRKSHRPCDSCQCRFSDCLPDPDGYPRSAHVHGRRRLRPESHRQERCTHHADPTLRLYFLHHDGASCILIL